MVVFGGDDLVSVVLDAGHCSIRTGIAGEELPKSVIPAIHGQLDEKSYWGESALLPKAGMEYRNLIEDGSWKDPSFFKSFLPSLMNDLKGTDENFPVCLIESGFNSTEMKSSICEMIFENNLAPAFYIAKNTVTASFALGKPTSLVVDIGAESVVVSPVVDGFVLKNNVMKSGIAGNFLSQKFEEFLTTRSYSPTVLYEIANKTPVNADQLPDIVKRQITGITESCRNYHKNVLIDDFKESTIFVAENGENINENSKGLKSYEFPDGYNFHFQVCPISEHLFITRDESNIGLADLIHRCISGCDVDLRSQLVSNIVLCGGGAAIPGLVDRLSFELSKFYSPAKLKFSFLGTSYEKRFTSWIGGSILCSMGTFQQMWATRKDYDEHGNNLANLKFL